MSSVLEEIHIETDTLICENEDFSVEFLIKKWRNLRDTYVRIKGEYIPSGSAAKKRKKWEFFDQLSFLNDTINYRPTTSNINIQRPSTSGVRISSPSASPTVTETHDNPPQTPKSSQSKRGPPQMEEAILQTLEKINTTPFETSDLNKVNPICTRISEMLASMPQQSRTLLEIKLLQVAYEGSKDFL